jgi:hypothetical protein
MRSIAKSPVRVNQSSLIVTPHDDAIATSGNPVFLKTLLNSSAYSSGKTTLAPRARIPIPPNLLIT